MTFQWLSVEVAVALFGLVGVFLGGVLNHVFSRVQERKSEQRRLMTEAYVAFLEAVSFVANAQGTGDHEQEKTWNAKLTTAKSRVTVYGDNQTVKRMADFFENHGNFETIEGYESYCRILYEMRKSTGVSTAGLALAELGAVTIGPANYSPRPARPDQKDQGYTGPEPPL